MNTTEIKKFLESIRETDIEEMEYESGDTSVYIKKKWSYSENRNS